MFVFKVFISILIIILSGYIGIYKSKKLKNREYILRDMVTFLSLVENEIKYMMSILPNAYESSRQKLITKLKDTMGEIVVDMLKLESDYLIDQSIVEKISKIEELSSQISESESNLIICI